MKTSTLAGYTSARYTWRHVVSEMWELLTVTTWEEFREELSDVITTFALFLWCNWRWDSELPSWCSSSQKYIERLELCKEVLFREGILCEMRAEKEPYYWAKYTIKGSNLEKEYKRRAFIECARLDLQ